MTAALLFDALTATMSDLAVGLLTALIFAGTLAFVYLQEKREAEREQEIDREVAELDEYVENWNFPPKECRKAEAVCSERRWAA